MVSNILLVLLITTNSIIVIYVAYQIYLKLKDKCTKEDIDPFADTDIYYKKLINEAAEHETINQAQNEESKRLIFP